LFPSWIVRSTGRAQDRSDSFGAAVAHSRFVWGTVTVVGISLLGASAVHAGGFALREQSAYGLGSAYAGVAAGGGTSLSSMFWNAATMTEFAGMQSETVLTGILPHVTNTPTGGFLAAQGLGGTGNIGIDSLVPAGYTSWQVTRDIWLGLAMNSPFGLAEHFPDNFAGRTYAGDTSLKSYNANPSVAYRFNDWLSVAAGVQIQYMTANLVQGIGPVPPLGLPPAIGTLRGDGWGYGFALGANFKPMPGTNIGIGYRSAINQKINGSESIPAGVVALGAPFPFGLGVQSTPGSVNTTLNLPGTLSVGLRQQITPQWTVLGTFEWTNWSRIGTATITQPNGNPALIAGSPVLYAFQYHDGWLASGGLEYKWSEALTLRGGLGFERSPVSDQVRVPLLPDNDRTWLAIGGTWNVTSRLAVDLGYSHVFMKSTSINVVSGNPNLVTTCALGTCLPFTYNGTVSSSLDIISVGLKYRFDTPVAPAKLITKG
jgi:long-chain fatty acid transport protein